MRSLVSVEHSQNAPRGEKAESTRRIERATSAALAMQRRDWEQGVFAQAMLQSGQRELLIQLTKAAMVQQTPDGRMGVVVNGGPKDDESAARFGRPSGTRNPILSAIPGFRYARPWAIFERSLRELCFRPQSIAEFSGQILRARYVSLRMRSHGMSADSAPSVHRGQFGSQAGKHIEGH